MYILRWFLFSVLCFPLLESLLQALRGGGVCWLIAQCAFDDFRECDCFFSHGSVGIGHALFNAVRQKESGKEPVATKVAYRDASISTPFRLAPAGWTIFRRLGIVELPNKSRQINRRDVRSLEGFLRLGVWFLFHRFFVPESGGVCAVAVFIICHCVHGVVLVGIGHALFNAGF